MPLLRRLWRLSALSLLLLLGVLLTLALRFELRNGIPGRKTQRAQRWWYRRVLKILNVRTQVTGRPCEEPALWVANHISWLDIPLLGSLACVGFLSKAEIRDWPVIGWLAASTGTLFIERGNRDASRKAADNIARHILNGHSVLVFPEGKTTPGVTVERFHARMFAPAVDHGLTVQPVALRYFNGAGEPHPRAPFVGGQSFLENIWYLAGERQVIARVTFLPAVDAGKYSERRPLADDVRQMVLEAFEKSAINQY